MADVVHDLLLEGAPDDALLTFAATDTSWTRGELLERGERCADALASLGVTPGDRVAVLLPNRIEYVDLIFGCSLLGAVVVHLHTASKGLMLERAVGLASPRVAVAQAEDAGRFEEVTRDPALRVISPEALAELAVSSPARAPGPPPTWRDAACIYSSSGTTGPAKGVTLPHRALFEMTRTAQAVMRFEPGDIAYAVTPLYHANAFVFMFMSTALTGGRTVLAERFSLGQFWTDVAALRSDDDKPGRDGRHTAASAAGRRGVRRLDAPPRRSHPASPRLA